MASKKISIEGSLRTRKGTRFLILLSLPIAAAGTAIALYVGWVSWEGLEMRSWKPVPARIIDSELKVSRSSDSTNYSVDAVYKYSVAGETYRGTRVNLVSGSDSGREYHERTYSMLEEHRREGRPFTAYYNPERPHEAILIRTVRLGLFALLTAAAATFGPLGYTLLFSAILAARDLRRQEHYAARFPDEPWRWRADWEDRYSATKDKKKTAMWMAILLYLLVLTAPLHIFALEYVQAGDWSSAFPAAPFLAFELFLLLLLSVDFGRWLRYGKSRLCFDSLPFKVGDHLRATLQTARPLPKHAPLELRVRCTEVRTVSHEKGTEVEREELWRSPLVNVSMGGFHGDRGTGLPISIPIEPGLPTAEENTEERQIEWELEAKCRTTGYDYHAHFDLPVFGIVAEATAEARAAQQMEAETVAAQTINFDPKVVTVEETAAGGLAFHFTPGRFLSGAFVLLTTGTIFCATAAGMVIYKADIPWFFVGTFGFFGVLLLLGAVQGFTGSVRTEVRPGALHIRRVLFLVRSHRTLTRDDIDEIITQVGTTENEQKYYDIYANTLDGARVLLGNHLPNKRAADEIADLMRSGLGLDT